MSSDPPSLLVFLAPSLLASSHIFGLIAFSIMIPEKNGINSGHRKKRKAQFGVGTWAKRVFSPIAVLSRRVFRPGEKNAGVHPFQTPINFNIIPAKEHI